MVTPEEATAFDETQRILVEATGRKHLRLGATLEIGRSTPEKDPPLESPVASEIPTEMILGLTSEVAKAAKPNSEVEKPKSAK